MMVVHLVILVEAVVQAQPEAVVRTVLMEVPDCHLVFLEQQRIMLEVAVQVVSKVFMEAEQAAQAVEVPADLQQMVHRELRIPVEVEAEVVLPEERPAAMAARV
jgi:hypothetical protein